MNALTQHVEMIGKDGRKVRKGQIRPPVRAAIALIVGDGVSIAEAAKRVGYQADSLSKALQRPHVRAYRADVKRAWLESKTSEAWVRVDRLSEKAESEKVRLEASRTILQAGGELQPVASEAPTPGPIITFIRHTETHHHGAAPAGPPVTSLVETSPGVWEVPDRV